MKDLEAKLKIAEKYKKEHEDCIAIFDKEIQSLKQQIADKEVTYSVGDRFTRGKVKYILIWGGYTEWCGLVNLTSGDVWSTGTVPVDRHNITAVELSEMIGCGNFTRYWNSQKGVTE